MKNCVREGLRTKLTATGTVTSGSFYKYGALLFCALASASSGERVVGMYSGEFSGAPKVAGQAWTENQALYWNGTAFTNVATGNAVGWARVAASPDTTGTVILAGVIA